MKDEGDMQANWKRRLLPITVCCLLVLGTACLLVGPAAQAQNIDAGKTAQQLFAGSCAACHRTPRGLAKGRFRPTLFVFLQDHYTSSAGTAWELSAYLASVDVPESSRSRTAASKKPKTPRPPAAVPSTRSN